MTQVSHAADTAAICAAINAQFSASDPAVPPDESAAKATSHIVPWVYRTFNGESRLDTGRVVVRYICKTWDDLDVFRKKTRTALDEQTFPSGLSCRFEDNGDTDTDEGWWVSDDSFTYAP